MGRFGSIWGIVTLEAVKRDSKVNKGSLITARP